MSLLATRMQNLRVNSGLDQNEKRASIYGAYNMFNMMTNTPGSVVNGALEEAAARGIGRDLQVPVINYDGTITIGNTRTLTIADSENTSALYTVSFATYAWGFTQTPALFMNNEIGEQKDFESKFNGYLHLFGNEVDNAAIAQLGADKTQVFTDPLNYTIAADTVVADWGQRENVIGDINFIMAANDHFGDIHLLGNAGAQSTIAKLAQKGLYNSENKQMEYGDKVLHFSPRLLNGVGEYANMIAVQGGSLGLLKQFEREAVLGTSMPDGTAWNIETLPLLDLPVSTYFYTKAVNATTLAGAASADMDRVVKNHFGFSVDLAFITPYNSDRATIANPIVKATILSEV